MVIKLKKNMSLDFIKDLLKKESEAILNIPVTEAYNKAVDLMHRHVHVNGGKVVTSGMGKAGQTAHNIATMLSATGTASIFLHPSEAQHGDLGIIQPNDVLLLVSNSGKTREIAELVELAKRLKKDIEFIFITGNPDTELGRMAHVTIATGNPKEICTLGLAPTTSTTAMNVICDVLVVLMEKRISFTADEYAKRHHGGYLGHQSRSLIEKGK
jgi:arabinose-5-phosphate isomerase